MTTNYAGEEGFRWFLGIVEDINDPLQLGRVKVRVLGEYGEDISTEDIDWAHMLMPNTSECVRGVGDTPGLTPGTNVVGFFLDSAEQQIMMVLGSYPTIPDMDDDLHAISYLARGKQTLEKKLVGTEPESSYAAQYPFNRVIQTKSGHVIELDDTPENERVHIFHKSGSYIEISSDGRVVSKSVDDKYEIIQGDGVVYVKGDVKIQVLGTCTLECPTTNIKGNVNVEGNIVATGEVTGKGIKLSTHRHTGVDTGTGTSLGPI